MQLLGSYAVGHFETPKARSGNPHPDIDLLAQMVFVVAHKHNLVHGQPLSRNKCFLLVWDYMNDELRPLAKGVPDALGGRTVFLGQGRFAKGSLRRWVGDIQGIVAAQRFLEGGKSAGRTRRDREALGIRTKADKHLQNIIKVATDHVAPAVSAALVPALQQLQKELFQ